MLLQPPCLPAPHRLRKSTHLQKGLLPGLIAHDRPSPCRRLLRCSGCQSPTSRALPTWWRFAADAARVFLPSTRARGPAGRAGNVWRRAEARAAGAGRSRPKPVSPVDGLYLRSPTTKTLLY